MKCSEFQRLIPEIIDNKIADHMLGEVISHVESCKDCYDELEIYYVLQYGLEDNKTKKSMNFIGQLEGSIDRMKQRYKRYETARAGYYFTQITAYTAVAGSFIYVLFKYLM